MGTQLVKTPIDVGGDVAEIVEARHHQHRERGDRGGEELMIRADVLDELELEAEHRAVAFGG